VEAFMKIVETVLLNNPTVGPILVLILGGGWVTGVFVLKIYKVKAQSENEAAKAEDESEAKAWKEERDQLHKERARFIESSDKMLDRVMNLTEKYAGKYITRDEFESYKKEIDSIQLDIEAMKKKLDAE